MRVKSLLPVFLLAGALAALVGVSVMLQRQINPRGRAPAPEESVQHRESREVKRATLEPGRVVVVKTNRGAFKIALFERDAPITCRNFLSLVGMGFYDKLRFHRVEDWVIQTGDPQGTGRGGSGRTIRLERIPGLGFEKPYTVGMARRIEDPDSASSQFFITKRGAPHLTGAYAAFGRVYEGQQVIDKIKKNDVVETIKIALPTEAERRALREKVRK